MDDATNRTTTEQQHAASELVSLARSDLLTPHTIQTLGTIVVGRDLASRAWQLKPWKEPRDLPPGTGMLVMDRALATMFQPEPTRVGQRWFLDDAGRQDQGFIAAERLSGDDLARVLRCRFYRELRREYDGDRELRKLLHRARGEARAHDERLPAQAWEDADLLQLAEASVGEYSLRGAVHPFSPLRGEADAPGEVPVPAEECLASVLEAVTFSEREWTVVSQRAAGDTTTEIAQKLGCSGRTIRRDLERVRTAAAGVRADLLAQDRWRTFAEDHHHTGGQVVTLIHAEVSGLRRAA
jgi:hypothetical protein